MSLRHEVVRRLRERGYELRRWNGDDARAHRVTLLRQHGVRTVLDIGANDGGYARQLREFGFRERIVSFEPLHSVYADLARSAQTDDGWDARNYGLGDADSTVTVNVAANDGASSSVLPMLEAHRSAAPGAQYVGTEVCKVRRLDSVWDELRVVPQVFAKVDVQGYEGQVLDGIGDRIEECVGVQLEVSFVPLYQGAMSWRDALERLSTLGFEMHRIDPVFSDLASGRLLQADACFFRGR